MKLHVTITEAGMRLGYGWEPCDITIDARGTMYLLCRRQVEEREREETQ